MIQKKKSSLMGYEWYVVGICNFLYTEIYSGIEEMGNCLVVWRSWRSVTYYTNLSWLHTT